MYVFDLDAGRAAAGRRPADGTDESSTDAIVGIESFSPGEAFESEHSEYPVRRVANPLSHQTPITAAHPASLSHQTRWSLLNLGEDFPVFHDLSSPYGNIDQLVLSPKESSLFDQDKSARWTGQHRKWRIEDRSAKNNC